jgi:CDP-glucose 4,6-dehydratase
LHEQIDFYETDIGHATAVAAVIDRVEPDVVFHLAAQSLVRASYEDPIGTLHTNVMGTANLLEALRRSRRRCAVVVVTSDKCYENREWDWGYRESDPVGGHDPYSSSKAAAELVTASYRRSFFPTEKLSDHGVAVASARAGNVIGFGDWARDRIVPDCVAALASGRKIEVRNPASVRPWQHVLEPLSGYLHLADRLLSSDRARYCEAWNFGPLGECEQTVAHLVDAMISSWGEGAWQSGDGGGSHEARQLKLSIDKAVARLGWRPAWGFTETVRRTARGYRDWMLNDRVALANALVGEIAEYRCAAQAAGALWAEEGT